jgi:hypothetical protein
VVLQGPFYQTFGVYLPLDKINGQNKTKPAIKDPFPFIDSSFSALSNTGTLSKRVLLIQ